MFHSEHDQEELLEWHTGNQERSNPSRVERLGSRRKIHMPTVVSIYSKIIPTKWFNRSDHGYLRVNASSEELQSFNMAYKSVFDNFPKIYNVYFLAMIGKYLRHSIMFKIHHN